MSSENRFVRIDQRPVFSVFFTAGYPRRDDTVPILEEVVRAGVGMVEIGFPFSDPIADGPTIQKSSEIAIQNGMNLEVLFGQLAGVRERVQVPILLMGYLNPILQFGIERFFTEVRRTGIDGLILPDLPFNEYRETWKEWYQAANVRPVFLVTARTPAERIAQFDLENPAFLYAVSSEATTGSTLSISSDTQDFLRRLKMMDLQSQIIVGFGVSDRERLRAVIQHADGAIVGSAFIRRLSDIIASAALTTMSDAIGLQDAIHSFVGDFIGPQPGTGEKI